MAHPVLYVWEREGGGGDFIQQCLETKINNNRKNLK